MKARNRNFINVLIISLLLSCTACGKQPDILTETPAINSPIITDMPENTLAVTGTPHS